MVYGAPLPPPPPPPPPPRQGGFLGFLTTLPGILTAGAAVITAVTGGVVLSNGHGSNGHGEDSSGGGTTYNISVVGEPVPAASGSVDPTSLSSSGLSDASADTGVDALVADCANGDADACTQLLDQLADECYQGYGLSCDVLYEISAEGSAYEDYGATCGGRYDWSYADLCSTL
jgi:hypothetical protein